MAEKEIAHRLTHHFGMSEQYWLDLQGQYDSNPKDDNYQKPKDRYCLAIAK